MSPMQAIGSDRLLTLLRELATDDRRLLECRIVDGWRYADIAVHLGVPRDVLVDRVRRLRTDLRRKERRSESESSPEANRRERLCCAPATTDVAGKTAVEVATRTAKAGSAKLTTALALAGRRQRQRQKYIASSTRRAYSGSTGRGVM